MTEDPEWSAWSGEALAECAERSALAINPLVYTEVSIRFERIEELDDALPEADFLRLPDPREKRREEFGMITVECTARCAPSDGAGRVYKHGVLA